MTYIYYVSLTRFFSSYFFQSLYNLNSSGGSYGFITGGGGPYYSSPHTLFGAPQRPIAFSPSTSYPSLLYNQQTIEQYYAILDMLSEMYMLSVSGLATRFLADAVSRSINNKPAYTINIEDQDDRDKAAEILEEWFSRVDIIRIIKNIMNDIIYYGSYSFWSDEDYNIHNLYDPVSVITVVGTNMQEIGYLINTYANGIVFMKKTDSRILRIGVPDLMLYTDLFNLNAEQYEEYSKNFEHSKRARNFTRMYSSKNKDLLTNEERVFIRPFVFLASTPLFYFTRTKLREYVIKDIILGLTTLRDLLYPLVFLLQHEYPAVQYTVQSLADQIEEILNLYADIGGLIGVRSNLQHILQMITYSIRVLPDFKSYISNLQPLDTSRLTEKLDKYRGEMRDLLEDISNDIGWPVDAFNARITYWESMRQSERFNNRVNYVTTSIEKSLSDFLTNMICEKLKIPYQEDLVRVQIFGMTINKLTSMNVALETVQNHIDGISSVIDNITSMITDKEYINKEELVNVLKSILQFIVTNPETLINWDEMIADMGGEGEDEEGFDFEMSMPGGEEEEETAATVEGAEEEGGETGEETEEM